jgi:hypothetical protein
MHLVLFGMHNKTFGPVWQSLIGSSFQKWFLLCVHGGLACHVCRLLTMSAVCPSDALQEFQYQLRTLVFPKDRPGALLHRA